MESKKSNRLGYVQAIISILIILCTFIPFIEDLVSGNDENSVSAVASFSSFFIGESEVTGEKETHIGAFFLVFIMLHLINIFVQTKKNIGLLAIAVSLFGIIPILLLNNYVGDVESYINSSISNYQYQWDYDTPFAKIEYEYQFGFYFIVVLMAIQVLAQLASLFITISNQNQEISAISNEEPVQKDEQPTVDAEPVPQPQVLQVTHDNELDALRAEAEALRKEQARIKAEEERQRAEREMAEKRQLEEELRQLKAKAEELERERLEKERIEKERIEKENLKREIEELKKMLEKQKTGQE